MTTITSFKIEDLRFPTSLTGDGTDASKSHIEWMGTRFPSLAVEALAADLVHF